MNATNAMGFKEEASTFTCDGEQLIGIVSLPQAPSRRGVLVVVGGPQYRAGSHRQFTLMCRDFAAGGIPAMRFDYRGMGDAEGETRTFEDVGDDIRAAIDHFCGQVPALSEVVICGLCDAASAATFYAYSDPRVKGVVLINPWARTTAGVAKARLRHYYGARIGDREFWQRLFRGEVAVGVALRSAARIVGAALGVSREPRDAPSASAARQEVAASLPLPERMADGLARFGGHVLLVCSGKDLNRAGIQRRRAGIAAVARTARRTACGTA